MSLRPHGRWSRLAVFLMAAFAMSAAHSGVKPEDEYKKLIRVSEDIQPLGEQPFGENISLYDGGLSFEQVDVSASGNGPLLQLVRQFKIEGWSATPERKQYAFGDWDLNLPRIETLTAHGWYRTGTGEVHEVNGWEVGGTYPYARCSQFDRPPQQIWMYLGDSALAPWEPSSWWRGYHLIIPGLGSQDLLSNSQADAATRALFPIVTKNHWRISCPIIRLKTGQAGEGFLAQSPDGTTYQFDELVYRQTQGISRPLYTGYANATPPKKRPRFPGSRDLVGDALAILTGSGDAHAAADSDGIYRQIGMMLVTRITDRFGNTLDFDYQEGRLVEIRASDGRDLTIQYEVDSPRIHSVTLQPSSGAPRVWVYSYGLGSGSVTTLTSVALPDDSPSHRSKWSFDLSAFDTATLAAGPDSSCLTLSTPSLTPITGSITHPSGLKGTFTVAARKHGRSFVPKGCVGVQHTEDDQGSYASIPNAWYSFTLLSKSLSGAGIPQGRVWQYQYSDPNESWSTCAGTCPTSVYTDVVQPGGSTTRYQFSNRFDYTESQLLQIDYYSGAVGGTPVRSEKNSYAPPDAPSLPLRAGTNPQVNVNAEQTTMYSPLNKRVITQNGDIYTWQAEAFNEYAQVTTVKRCNSFARPCDSSFGLPPIRERTDYLNVSDTTRLVLGLPAQVTNLTGGKVEVVDRYSYDSTNQTLTARSHFGQTLMNYVFYPSDAGSEEKGQLKSFTDGNLKTTTLSDYRRGIPQTISYPDTESQTLVVDDFGQIRSITDQANAKTSYDYDAVGRLTRVIYPKGEQSWYPKTFSYDFVTYAENGVAANHWRRTVAKGDQRSVTYFDAELRPVLADTFICRDMACASTTSHSWISTGYDYRGLTTFKSYPAASSQSLANGISSDYDALGRLLTTTQASELGPLTTSTTYLSGARKRVEDPKHYVTTTTYQAFDTPSYDAVIKVQAPEAVGLTQTIVRDIYGAPQSITQAGQYDTGAVSVTKTLSYDSYHRLCRVTEPESGSELMDYDGANNLLRSVSGLSLPAPTTGTPTDCQRTLVADAAWTVRQYDPMNRVEFVDYPTGTDDIAYTYKSTGAIETAASGLTRWTYGYNVLGQLKSETLDIEGQQWPATYIYDAYGSVSTITYPDGKQIDYAPDPLGRPTKVGAYARDIAYFPDGSVQYYRLGNGTEYVAGQEDERPILSSLSYLHGADSPVVDQQYTYDGNGNLTDVKDWVDGRRDKTYGYDELNRLRSALAPNLSYTESYRYDPLNNLREVISDGATHTYVYNALNQLTTITDGIGGATLHSYGYTDGRGNVTLRDGASLQFDKANRLTMVVGGSQYAYDAFARRVKKSDALGNDTYYAYSSDGRLLYQLDAAAGSVTDYIYLGRKLTAEVRRNQGDPVLNPPEAITFDTNPNNGSYTVSWGAVDTATYELQETNDNGANWLDIGGVTSTSKSFSGKGGGRYVYRVRACFEECSDWRVSSPLGVTPALATVNVPSQLQGANFTVSWSRPASATRFDVEEQKDGGTWSPIATNTVDTSLSRNNLASGTYIYRVWAKNDFGSRGAATSGPVTVLYPPVSAPTLNVPAVSSTSSYTVSWGAVPDADRYQLREQKNGVWGPEYDTPNRSKLITGVTNGARYGYQVAACNAAGCGPYSAVKTVEIAIPPPAPTGVYANHLTVNPKLETLTVVWNVSPGATVYEIKDLNAGTVVTSTAGTSAEVERGYGEPLPHHDYAVDACNSYACSAWIAAQYRNIYNPPNTAPSLSVPAVSGTGSYTVSWSAVYQATSYTLQESKNGGTWTSVASTGTAKSFSGKANASYSYRVRASNSGGSGPWSATATVKVTTVTGVTGLSATVAWVGTMDSAAAFDAPVESSSTESTTTSSGDALSPMMMPPPPTETYAWYVSAKWNAATNATHYEIKVTDTTSGAVSTYSVTTTYLAATKVSHSSITVSARACSASSCSAWSSAVTAVKQ